MLFVLSYAMLKAIVNPDEGKKSFGPGLIKRIVIAVVGLAIAPALFNLMYQVQGLVLEHNVLGKLFFRSDNTTLVSPGTVDVGGQQVALDDVNPDNWTNEQWKKELLSISYVAEPLALRNIEKELKGYPADRVYIDINNLGSSLEDEVRLDVLSNLLGAKEEPFDSISLFFRRVFRVRSTTIDNDFGINHSTILRKMFKSK
jgi:hypothetical protein